MAKRDAGLKAISGLSANMGQEESKKIIDSILKQAGTTPEELNDQAEKLYTDSWGQRFGDEGREGGKDDYEDHISELGEERWNVAKNLKSAMKKNYGIEGKSSTELRKASGSHFNESTKPLKLKDLIRQ